MTAQARSFDTLDALVTDLNSLRVASGDVSYADLAARIGRMREAAGMSPAMARVARSSVFDTFRLGRKRMNPDLVAEIVLALGLAESEAEQWRARCLRARAAAREPAVAEENLSELLEIVPIESDPPHAVRSSIALLVMVACVGLNLFGGEVMSKFHLPLYLDMIGTAIGAIALGPWRGALIGLTSNLLDGVAADFDTTVPFGLVNVVGGLVWGFGVRQWALGRSWGRFFRLNVTVALACSLTAVPILVLLFGGTADHPVDIFTVDLRDLGTPLWAAVFSTNIATSLADKLLSGPIAMLVVILLVNKHVLPTPDLELAPWPFRRRLR